MTNAGAMVQKYVFSCVPEVFAVQYVAVVQLCSRSMDIAVSMSNAVAMFQEYLCSYVPEVFR
jgi:hypothetical protein